VVKTAVALRQEPHGLPRVRADGAVDKGGGIAVEAEVPAAHLKKLLVGFQGDDLPPGERAPEPEAVVRPPAAQFDHRWSLLRGEQALDHAGENQLFLWLVVATQTADDLRCPGATVRILFGQDAVVPDLNRHAAHP